MPRIALHQPADDRVEPTTHSVNIADRPAVEKLPDEVVAAHGQVDGVINVAGIVQRFVRVPDLGFDEIERRAKAAWIVSPGRPAGLSEPGTIGGFVLDSHEQVLFRPPEER